MNEDQIEISIEGSDELLLLSFYDLANDSSQLDMLFSIGSISPTTFLRVSNECEKRGYFELSRTILDRLLQMRSTADQGALRMQHAFVSILHLLKSYKLECQQYDQHFTCLEGQEVPESLTTLFRTTLLWIMQKNISLAKANLQLISRKYGESFHYKYLAILLSLASKNYTLALEQIQGMIIGFPSVPLYFRFMIAVIYHRLGFLEVAVMCFNQLAPYISESTSLISETFAILSQNSNGVLDAMQTGPSVKALAVDSNYHWASMYSVHNNQLHTLPPFVFSNPAFESEYEYFLGRNAHIKGHWDSAEYYYKQCLQHCDFKFAAATFNYAQVMIQRQRKTSELHEGMEKIKEPQIHLVH